jgi:hypothetical protein
MGERILPAALLIALGIVAYREINSGNTPPRPFRFVGVALIYTVLGVLALASANLAAAFAIAIDLGLIVKPDLLGGTTGIKLGTLTTNTPVLKGSSLVGA